MRTALVLALAACGGSSSPPPLATPLAPPPETAPPSESHGPPAPPNMPTVIPADKLSWMESDSSDFRRAMLWQAGDARGDILEMPGDSAIRSRPKDHDEAWIRLSVRPRIAYVATSDAPAPMLRCDGMVPCRFYRHPIPSGAPRIDSLAWQPYGPERQFAAAWGKLDGGPAGVLVQIRAGTQPFWHMHRRDVHMVVLAGTVEFIQSGAGVHSLEAGSYVRQPGGYKHTERCTSATDCVVYIHSDNGFDVKPL